MPLEHSDRMGGSSAAKRIHCPGSYQLEEKVPKAPASEFAERGNALHEAMEHYLLECEGAAPEVLLGMEFNGFTIDQDMLAMKIKPALAALDGIILEAGGDLDYIVEAKASLDRVIPGAFGTVDLLGMGKDGRLWVIDWKFGDGVPVSPEANYQMAFYTAAALYDEDCPDIADLIDVEAIEKQTPPNIVFVIVQPREGYDEPDWQKWETSVDWIEGFLDQAVTASDQLDKPDAPLAIGDWCRWCRAKHTCPLQQDAAVAAVAGVSKEPSTLDAVQLADWMGKADQLEDFIKNLRKHVHAELERGVKIPGYKLVNKRGSRVYNDQEAAEKALRKKLKVAECFKKELISPAQAEKALGKKDYEKILAPHVSMVSSGTTVAPASDKRADVSDSSKHLAEKLAAHV